MFGLLWPLCTMFYLSVVLVNGKSPGHHFWGVTTIAYMARDRSGNAAICSFVVNVTGKVLIVNSTCLYTKI